MNATRKKIGLWSCALAVFLMTGCKADVDLNNIDTRAQFDFGFALPVGSMNVSFKDILGDSLLAMIHEDENGVLSLVDTFHITRQYHDVDLSQHISKVTKYCNVHDALDDVEFLDNNQLIGLGIEIPLSFPFSLKLEGINEDEYKERLDSALINNTRFISRISTRNLGIDERWVTKVELSLSDVFHRAQGNTITVCEGNYFHYNEDIPINIDQFVICLMKNLNPKDPTEYLNNVKDSINLEIKFYVKVPFGQVVQIPSDAAFQYDLSVQFIDYEAIWGYFDPSNQMYDEGVVDLFKEWNFWEKFKDAILPFAEPVINMYTTTQVAGAMKIHGDYLYAAGMDNDTVYATFNGQRFFNEYFEIGQPSAEYNYDNGYLPLSSEIGDSARMYIRFDNTEEHGNIDQMFTIRPASLGYKFIAEFNRDKTPQLRITSNTAVHMAAELIAPFKFKEGFKIKYQSTIDDVDISSLSIESIFENTPGFDSVKDGQLALILKAYNYIPLNIKGVFRFMDARGEVIMDPLDPTQPLHFYQHDTVDFNVPTAFEYRDGKYYATEPGESAFALYITKENSYLLEEIKSINFEIIIDSEDLKQAFEEYKDFSIDLLGDNYIKLGVGVATNLSVIFDYTKTY